MASNPDNCNVERIKTAGSGAVIGGGIGTVVLGPGLGTAIGTAIGAYVGDRVASSSGHCKPTSCPCDKRS
jgi:uncharacterized membrane protein